MPREEFLKNENLWNKEDRALEARNVTIAQTTLGELYQLILNALAKLCNQKKFLAEFERTGKCLGTACDSKYLQIKCKDKSSRDCTHTKKKFHSKIFSSLSGKPQFSRRSSKKWKFIKKKKQRGRTFDRCFICQKRSHFVRNCPDKKRSQALIQALNQVEPVDVSNLESLYSLDDEPSDSVLYTIAYSDFSSDDDSDTDSLESDSNFGRHASPFCRKHHPTHIQYQQYKAKTHPNLLKPSPLWLNPSFFVSLPFKQNEDVNPTKASHHGMNPDHYQLAKEECEQLVSQADDKFPLLQKKSLFQHLADAKVLSKFDLKSRSSLPVESNAVWLKKNAPSAFQKAMITIFEPILVNTLVYIYDILLFSPDEQSHAELLSKFYSLVTKYGIMLSEKKMEVRVTTIQFFGMEISDRKY
ncbi:putative zinc finger, CCHC-type containing protein [Tanacetum coccineum]